MSGLVWTARTTYLVAGTPFGVRSTSAAAAATLHERLAAFPAARTRVRRDHRYSLVAASAPTGLHSTFAGCRPLLRAATWDPLFDHLLRHMAGHAVDAFDGVSVPATVIAADGVAVGLLGADADTRGVAMATATAGFVPLSLHSLCVTGTGTVAVLPVPGRLPPPPPGRQFRLGHVVEVESRAGGSLRPVPATDVVAAARPSPDVAGWLAGVRGWRLTCEDVTEAARVLVDAIG